MSDHKAANRFEAILASDLGGVPVALILCVVAAIVLGAGIAMASSIH
jgi:hypothetical protein